MIPECFQRHREQLVLGELSNSRGELCGWAFKLYTFALETGSVCNSRVINQRNKGDVSFSSF